MGLNDKIKELLDDFNEKLVIDTRESLQSKLDERAAKHNGKKVKSRLWASVKAPPAIYDKGLIKSKLLMNDYWAVVNDGRRASNVSEEGQEKIVAWSATRGLAEKIRISDLEARKQKQSLSERKNLKTLKKMPFDRAKKAAGFLVARSLKKKALEPTHFFDEVLNDGRVDKLRNDLAELVKTEFTIEIRKEIKK
jgi:hypothetical protein